MGEGKGLMRELLIRFVLDPKQWHANQIAVLMHSFAGLDPRILKRVFLRELHP